MFWPFCSVGVNRETCFERVISTEGWERQEAQGHGVYVSVPISSGRRAAVLILGRRPDLEASTRPQGSSLHCVERRVRCRPCLSSGSLELLAAGDPRMVCQPRARPFWVFCKVQLTIWPSRSGTMVTRLPETTVSGSPSPRRPPQKDKKCDLPLLL